MKYFLGLDLGNTAIKAVVFDEHEKIVFKKSHPHFGRPQKVAGDLLEDIAAQFEHTYILCSGAHGHLISEEKYLKGEIPALQKGVLFWYPNAKSLIEIGAQNARYLTNLSPTSPPLFAVNEDCAGGTGSFFEDQMNRLGLSTEDYARIIEQANTVARLSGRCSVFAKTDIIHRQQEGVPMADILLGLSYAAVKNFKATIIKNLPIQSPLVLGGGIIHNQGVIRAVADIFCLSEDDFYHNKDNEFLQALGTAKMALTEKDTLPIQACLNRLKSFTIDNVRHTFKRWAPLEDGPKTSLALPTHKPLTSPTYCSLGIDVGSTSINLVLIKESGEMIDAQYLRTQGRPAQVVKNGLEAIYHQFGDNLIIKSVGVTGSGRHLIGKMIGADSIKDEITAQAKSAICTHPLVDTVFEIGGQDAKYIQIHQGHIQDFQMNKICAAGTGSFIEEQANRLQVALSDYGEIALSAKNPVDLGERCTVFIENNIHTCLSHGVHMSDILAGLCYAVVRNYLIKVVGNKPVGNTIVLQGGICYNPAVIAAFKAFFGQQIHVSPYFSVSGAYGVATLALEEMGRRQTNFLGFHLSKQKTTVKNPLKIDIQKNIKQYNKAKDLLLDHYERTLSSDKKIIGVPYVLVVHKFFPMIRTYFEHLGFQVLLSPETDENIIADAQKYAKAETCYPVKLIYGHMAWLAKQKVDYIFLPSIHTMKHETSKVHHNYGCVYMQSAPRFVFDTMNLSAQGISLLNPIFSLDFGKEALASEMIGVGKSLGFTTAKCGAALAAGAMAVRKHTLKLEAMGKELLNRISPTEKVMVLVTRTYGLNDPVLNMEIPYALLSLGYKVITLSHLPAHDLDISQEYENLYWPFGQHMIAGAKLIANHPNLYAIYLTNHGCGPDSMIAHLFQKEMGQKPFLHIEVDEHYSKVGVITRIEAFLNSLNAQPISETPNDKQYFKNIKIRRPLMTHTCKKDMPIFLPHFYPHSFLLAKEMNKKGYRTKVLPTPSKDTLAMGRSITMTKEYLSFVALAGDVLKKAQTTKEPCQIILPQTEGSETDGLYARLIYNQLSSESFVHLVVKTLETLAFDVVPMAPIFWAILAGDVILSFPADKQESLRQQLCQGDLTPDDILAASAQHMPVPKKKVLLVGEPYILYNETLYEHLFSTSETKEVALKKMPLAEYLLFLWQRRAETKAEKEQVHHLASMMEKVHLALGKHSNFCPNFYDLAPIGAQAIGSYTGANGAYRLAKHKCADAEGLIDVASMYENTQTILNLFPWSNKIPRLSLSFEGSNDKHAKEKLASFLYYI